MRDTLQRNIYAGVRKVQFSPDHVVEYPSIDDMRKVLADLNAQIASTSGTTPPSFSLATHSRE